MFKKYLSKVIMNCDLTEKEMEFAMKELIDNNINESLKASFLTALKVKGETIEEITAAAKVMRNKVEKIQIQKNNTLDTCGTGGDNSLTYNISTAVAFVCAANDICVVKHGNRSVSSKCGSADVLEELGVNINLEISSIEKCIDKENIGFLFAPKFHKSVKNIMKTRKELGFRTIFNILGPLTNPAFAQTQILGVFDEKLTESIANVLKNLGVKRALVVHGLDGLDEITITNLTKVSELNNEEIKTYYINPVNYGFELCKKNELIGGDSCENAKIIKSIFNGMKGPKRDILVINSAAALYINGVVSTIEQGIILATKTIDDKKALRKLNSFIEITGKLA
jgi:anthranilate phosphoribosyltransferase